MIGMKVRLQTPTKWIPLLLMEQKGNKTASAWWSCWKRPWTYGVAMAIACPDRVTRGGGGSWSQDPQCMQDYRESTPYGMLPRWRRGRLGLGCTPPSGHVAFLGCTFASCRPDSQKVSFSRCLFHNSFFSLRMLISQPAGPVSLCLQVFIFCGSGLHLKWYSQITSQMLKKTDRWSTRLAC